MGNIFKNISTRHFIAVCLNIIFFIIIGCDPSNREEAGKMENGINKMSLQKLNILGDKYIFFGHQSVGWNIIEGIIEIKKTYPKLKLNIVEINRNERLPDVPSFVHAYIGRNTDPLLKINEFSRRIEIEKGNIGIAFFKLCYIDFDYKTDIKEIFNNYKTTMNRLKSQYPNITFIHFTVPLTTSKPDMKSWVKKWLGERDIPFMLNVKRNKYNDMLRNEYLGREPFFDLAEIESTRKDGSRSSFEENGKTFFTLADEYSEDGAHLNNAGKNWVAGKLLIYLAEIM
jgi:hypothetical protein